MDTMETGAAREAQHRSAGTEPRNSQFWSPWVVLGVAVAVVVGLGIGVGARMLFERDGDQLDAIRACGGELSARQEEMVETIDDYIAAVQASDGDGVAAHMTAGGFVEYLGRGWTHSVSDCSLQEWFSSDRYGSLRLVGPMVVCGDRVLLFGAVDDKGYSWTSIIRFTSTGDARIVSESIDHW